MAIRATYTGHNTFKNAHIKLGRIWGSKEEQWNAWVNVYGSPSDKDILATFSIQCPYVEGENPYSGLYISLGNESFLSDVIHDDVSQDTVIVDAVKVLRKKREKV
jgi:hypothetical protein